jgi:copper chaperone CopZ
MTHTYTVTGMTCSSCEANVKSALLSVPHVLSAEVSKAGNTATIETEKHIDLAAFQKALGGENGKYKISANHHNKTAVQTKGWFSTYKPVLLIFTYILTVTLFVSPGGVFQWQHWMNSFMAGFFLVFSFFKLLNLQAFAESYSMYDIVAKRWNGWGYIYAFIELALGIAFLTGFKPVFTNAVAFIVMSVSIIGVLQSMLNKRKIQCACLGSVFDLPMSTITIIEDTLMIAMSGIMLIIMV